MKWLTVTGISLSPMTTDLFCLSLSQFGYFPIDDISPWFVTIVTRLVPLVKQELLKLPEHVGSQPVFSRDSRCSISSFLCSVVWIIIWLYVPLTVVLCFFFQLTVSDYPFGLFWSPGTKINKRNQNRHFIDVLHLTVYL